MRIPYLPLLKMSMSSTALSSSSTSSLPVALPVVPDTTGDTSSFVIGLNAALQKRFVIDNLKEEDIIPGNVYRASSISYGVGGKGQDVAYTLNCLQYRPFHLVQFIGTGYEGDTVYHKMSRDFAASQTNANRTDSSGSCLSDCTVRTASILRTCTSIVTNASTTELIDPSGVIALAEINELIDRIQQTATVTAKETNIKSICFMGSMPPGCASDLYAKIYRTIVTAGTTKKVLCFIDSVVGLNELLQQISQLSSVSSAAAATTTTKTILKINVAELCRYVNVPILKESEGISMDSVVEAITKFWQLQQQLQHPSAAGRDGDGDSSKNTPMQPSVIALTNGAHPAYLAILKSHSRPAIPESSSSSSLLLSFDLHQLPIASPFSVLDDEHDDGDDGTTATPKSTLYPIGAGDAVAAGTFAAWNYYVATTREEQPSSGSGNTTLLPESIRQVLDKDRSLWNDQSIDSDELYLSCFRFGLACGSASCRQEENSIVSVAHVRQLYDDKSVSHDRTNDQSAAVARSAKSTHSIPMNELTEVV